MDYTISPISEHTGAEVRSIDLTEPIDEVARARLNRAFVDYSVLVFRDQHLTPRQLLAAVGLFGEPFPQHNSRFALPECPLVHYISNQDFYPGGRSLSSGCPLRGRVGRGPLPLSPEGRRGIPHRRMIKNSAPRCSPLSID